MLKHIWSLLCRESVIDKDTNNLSVFNIFEQVHIEALQTESSTKNEDGVVLPIDFEIISFWYISGKNETTSAEVLIEHISPDGAKKRKFEQKLKIRAGLKRMRSKVRVQSIRLKQSGDHFFRISFKENSMEKFKTVAEVPLEVSLNIKPEVNKE